MKKNGFRKQSKALSNANIIPNLYITAYVKSLDYQIKNIVNDTDLGDVDHKLRLDFILGRETKLDAVKTVLEMAIERSHFICDYDDTNHQYYKVGFCENEYHDETIPKKKIRLELVLMGDEDIEKMDEERPQYWCKRCIKESNENDQHPPISCDMDHMSA